MLRLLNVEKMWINFPWLIWNFDHVSTNLSCYHATMYEDHEIFFPPQAKFLFNDSVLSFLKWQKLRILELFQSSLNKIP